MSEESGSSSGGAEDEQLQEEEKGPPRIQRVVQEIEARKGVDPLNDSERFRDNNRF